MGLTYDDFIKYKKQFEDDLDCIQLKNFYKTNYGAWLTNYWEIKILKEKRKGKSFIY